MYMYMCVETFFSAVRSEGRRTLLHHVSWHSSLTQNSSWNFGAGLWRTSPIYFFVCSNGMTSGGNVLRCFPRVPEKQWFLKAELDAWVVDELLTMPHLMSTWNWNHHKECRHQSHGQSWCHVVAYFSGNEVDWWCSETVPQFYKIYIRAHQTKTNTQK